MLVKCCEAVKQYRQKVQLHHLLFQNKNKFCIVLVLTNMEQIGLGAGTVEQSVRSSSGSP